MVSINVLNNGIYKTCNIVFIFCFFIFMCTNVCILRKRCECVVNTVLFVNDILHGGCFNKTWELVILPEHFGLNPYFSIGSMLFIVFGFLLPLSID